MNGYSRDLKVLENIKDHFIQRVGAKDWGDAKERFTELASEKIYLPFSERNSILKLLHSLITAVMQQSMQVFI